jgi:hypothetical protein
MSEIALAGLMRLPQDFVEVLNGSSIVLLRATDQATAGQNLDAMGVVEKPQEPL